MPDWTEQIDPALAVLEHRMGRVNVSDLVAVLCEDDDRRIRVALGIFGVDGARERRTVVGKQPQPIPLAEDQVGLGVCEQLRMLESAMSRS